MKAQDRMSLAKTHFVVLGTFFFSPPSPSFYFLFWIIKPLIFVSAGKWWCGPPWEPAENLNRVAPAGVSLVVTGCSPGPPVPLNAAGGETIAWNLSFRWSIPRLSTPMKSVREDDAYGFPLPARLSSGFDPSLRPEPRVTQASWILQRM